MLPGWMEKKLVDMNVTSLKDRDLEWADFVFISAISIQKKSVKELIARCKKIGVKIVAGGPLFTTGYEEFKGIEHFILNEAEITLPPFLDDLRNGNPKHIYTSNQRADISKTPIPLWKLINMKKYGAMNIQYSRGCPFNCEFCDITLLYGNIPRIKDKHQVLAELESLYLQGWKGGVFFVDDNFIGNRKKLKREILPAIAEWMERRKYAFSFFTQASIDISDDEELMQLMVKAGFDTVFVGIETPNEESLNECMKFQNKNRDLIACVKKIQKFGLQVQGGFIVGFDNDPLSIFEKQIEFIQKSGIVTAMVGLLNALRGTRLYRRLEKEERLLTDESGDNTDCSINFIPRMNYETLIKGYKRILSTIRIFRFRFSYLGALFKSIFYLGIIGKERVYYWKLVLWSLFRRPRSFPLAVTFTIYGFHFRKIFEEIFKEI